MVQIVEPRETELWTNDDVLFDFSVEGGVADRVELLRDGSLFQVLEGRLRATFFAEGRPDATSVFVGRAYVGADFVESEPVVVHSDATAPRPVRTSPNAGDDNVAVENLVSVTFDEPIDPDSISTDAMALVVDPVSLTIEGLTLSEDGRTLSARLAEYPWRFSRTVQVTYGTGLRDRAGNRTGPRTFSFALPDWLTMAQGGVPSGDTKLLEMKLDDADGPWVAYTEPNGASGAARLYVARRDGSRWTQVGSALNADSDESATEAKLARNDAGTFYAAWIETATDDEGGRADVRVAELIGGDWTLLGGAVGEDRWHTGLELALDGDGRPVVSFRTTGNDDADVVAVHRYDGTGWARMGDVLITADLDQPFCPMCGTCSQVLSAPSGGILAFAGNGRGCRAYEWDDASSLWQSRPSVGDWGPGAGDTWRGNEAFAVGPTGLPVVAKLYDNIWLFLGRADGYWTLEQRTHERDYDVAWQRPASVAVSSSDVVWLGVRDDADVYHVGEWQMNDIVDAGTFVGAGAVMALDGSGRPVVALIEDDPTAGHVLRAYRWNRFPRP